MQLDGDGSTNEAAPSPPDRRRRTMVAMVIKRPGCWFAVIAAGTALAALVYIVQKPSYDEALRDYDRLRAAALSVEPSDLVCGLSGEHSFVASGSRTALNRQRLSVFVSEVSGCLDDSTVSRQKCRGLVVIALPLSLVRGVDGGITDGGAIDLGGETFAVVRGSDYWDGRCERRITAPVSSGRVSVNSVTADGFEIVWSVALSNGGLSRGRVPVRWDRR